MLSVNPPTQCSGTPSDTRLSVNPFVVARASPRDARCWLLGDGRAQAATHRSPYTPRPRVQEYSCTDYMQVWKFVLPLQCSKLNVTLLTASQSAMSLPTCGSPTSAMPVACPVDRVSRPSPCPCAVKLLSMALPFRYGLISSLSSFLATR